MTLFYVRKLFSLFVWINLIFTVITFKSAYAQSEKKSKEEDDIQAQFKEARFLQVERISVPKELKKIENQIHQNITDVILISKTHTPVYAQKRDGYTDSYKKFFGLEVRISPIPGQNDSYSVDYFYYNWTTNKYDKSIYKKISKYNVLNEVRFGMYELFFGKDYVEKNKEEIEEENFDRIQEIRKSNQELAKKKKSKNKRDESPEEEEEKEAKAKKKKLMREEKERKKKMEKIPATPIDNVASEVDVADSSNNDEPDVSSETEKALQNKTNDNGKKKKSSLPSKPKEKNNNQNDIVKKELNGNSSQSATSGAEAEVPKEAIIYATSGVLGDFTEATTLGVTSKTNLRYLGFGLKVDVKYLSQKRRGIRTNIRFAIPILKQNFSFPVYKGAESEYYWSDLFQGAFSPVQLYAGGDYSPVNFVALPDFGARLQVFENDFLWAKFGIGYETNIKEKPFLAKITYFQSLMMKSNQNRSFSGFKLNFSGHYELNNKHSLELTYQQCFIDGDILLSTKGFQLNYFYKFDN